MPAGAKLALAKGTLCAAVLVVGTFAIWLPYGASDEQAAWDVVRFVLEPGQAFRRFLDHDLGLGETTHDWIVPKWWWRPAIFVGALAAWSVLLSAVAFLLHAIRPMRDHGR